MPDGSSSVSDIQGYSNNLIEKYEAVNSNLSIDIYTSRFNNRLVSKIKDGCKLEFQNLKPWNYLVAHKKLIHTKQRMEKIISSLEVVEFVLVQYHLVENQYQPKVWCIIYFYTQ